MICRTGLVSGNGGRPTSRSYSVAPRLYTSVRRSIRWVSPRACSGAMYAGVPSVAPVAVRSGALSSRTSPKSITYGLRSPSAVSTTITLLGLRSRCTRPWLWAAATPSATWTISRTFSSTVSAASSSPSTDPSRYCIAM